MRLLRRLYLFCYIPNLRLIPSVAVCQMALLGFYAAAGIQTHVRRVATTWDLLRGLYRLSYRAEACHVSFANHLAYFWPQS